MIRKNSDHESLRVDPQKEGHPSNYNHHQPRKRGKLSPLKRGWQPFFTSGNIGSTANTESFCCTNTFKHISQFCPFNEHSWESLSGITAYRPHLY